MARSHRHLVVGALGLGLAACSSSAARLEAEIAALTGLEGDEVECIEDSIEPDDPNPLSALPDCVGIDRLSEVASITVGNALEIADERVDELRTIAEENGLDLDRYQECLADRVATLSDRELRTAFAAPTAEELGERLAAPFATECVAVAIDAPTLGVSAAEAASLVSGAIGRIDATKQGVTVPDTGDLTVYLVGDPADPIAAIGESPDGDALNVQVILTNTRLADAALSALGERFGFDPPTATNLTVTGSRPLTDELLACVLDNPVSVTIRPGPRPCDE